MLPSLPLLVLCLAVVGSLVQRLLPPPRAAVAEPKRIRVCLSCGSRDPWQECVLKYVRAAAAPAAVRFGVAIECSSVDDICTDDSLRRIVVLHHTTPSPSDRHQQRLWKLIRKFVDGSETLVVLADKRLAPVYGWDASLLACNWRPNAILTCPASAHKIAFPTLRRRSDGTVCRAEARPMLAAAQALSVPAVCACAEFLAAPPRALVAWRQSRAPVHDLEGCVVPTFPLLVPCACEEDVLDVCEQPMARELGAKGKLGLSANPTREELQSKYGSSVAAKLAIKMDGASSHS